MNISKVIYSCLCVLAVVVGIFFLVAVSKENDPHDPFDGQPYYWGGQYPPPTEETTTTND